MAVAILGAGTLSFLRRNAAEDIGNAAQIRWRETFFRFYGRKDEREEFREATG
jgi:hypothetical protein